MIEHGTQMDHKHSKREDHMGERVQDGKYHVDDDQRTGFDFEPSQGDPIWDLDDSWDEKTKFQNPTKFQDKRGLKGPLSEPIQVHGNYGGYRWTSAKADGGDYTVPSIDSLDEMFKRHDYNGGRFGNVQADRLLIRDLEQLLKSKKLGLKHSIKAKLAALYFRAINMENGDVAQRKLKYPWEDEGLKRDTISFREQLNGILIKRKKKMSATRIIHEKQGNNRPKVISKVPPKSSKFTAKMGMATPQFKRLEGIQNRVVRRVSAMGRRSKRQTTKSTPFKRDMEPIKLGARNQEILGKQGGMILPGEDLIGAVVTQTTGDIPNTFILQNNVTGIFGPMGIGPSMMQDSKANVNASIWEYFQFIQCTFKYIPNVAVTVSGTAIAFVDEDPGDTDTYTVANVVGLNNKRVFNVNSPMEFSYKHKGPTAKFFVDPNQEVRLCFAGNFGVIVQSTPQIIGSTLPAGSVLGNMYCRYRLKFTASTNENQGGGVLTNPNIWALSSPGVTFGQFGQVVTSKSFNQVKVATTFSVANQQFFTFSNVPAGYYFLTIGGGSLNVTPPAGTYSITSVLTGVVALTIISTQSTGFLAASGTTIGTITAGVVFNNPSPSNTITWSVSTPAALSAVTGVSNLFLISMPTPTVSLTLTNVKKEADKNAERIQKLEDQIASMNKQIDDKVITLRGSNVKFLEPDPSDPDLMVNVANCSTVKQLDELHSKDPGSFDKVIEAFTPDEKQAWYSFLSKRK